MSLLPSLTYTCVTGRAGNRGTRDGVGSLDSMTLFRRFYDLEKVMKNKTARLVGVRMELGPEYAKYSVPAAECEYYIVDVV